MSTANLGAKKRRCPRVDMEIPGEIASADAKRHEVAIGNLGPEGAFIKTTKKIEAGTPVKLCFKLSSHPLPFEAAAEVRWHREGAEGGIGLQFVEFPPYDRAAIDDFCQHRLEETRGAAATAER